ncbi:putative ATP-dependent RNA helicase [Gregarina niphandrodes]|uniref:ATP-dependent RNA helicase n=1 Tax=Gregarina niphandrodes TaxID=110365 RepID=A0A023B1B1_GRENI|nr:putative ATP-dependent RNA helicase [Gregarina niphandrodes]EZG45502.1 putative ATP-dependent RNA helicase [Gregarina niphandrodes]|eukprot:XP_011132478.1 putative ATP-dependent RNA helicase [Gregarina niphandrodes]
MEQPVWSADVVIEKLDGEKSKLDETTKNCVHEIVRPASWEVKVVGEYEPARKFAYPLDPFQKTAIDCIEMNESVLVAAHTSAGKTTVAEYAIALALKNKSRVIYTAPIKALSNQKFRDLQEQFQDVGLMTGDVTLNPNASVIIMTTEILRSILYRGSELVREVKWVIFDEIHYMRDRDRGVIWEETIVLLPDSVRQVFLSATVPNTLEFAEWICRTKHQPCHVVSTSFRPTPLQHYLFPAGGEGLSLVMNEHRQYQEDNYRHVLQQLSNDRGASSSRNKKRRVGGDDLERILLMCNEKNFTPVIVFAFSKKEVEENASVISSLDLTTEQEKRDIQKIYDSAVSTLSEQDRDLPQVTGILPHLLKGIGIHHGGLLPMVKEVIEILFQELLIKVLFSTETFSMGINMPARTVVFTGLHKFDGQEKRMISPGEYIQMSGRAGRRGIDTKGYSIVIVQSLPGGADQGTASGGSDELRQLFTGEAFRLDSNFYMKYNTILNLFRVEGASPEYMIKRSFLQFQTKRNTITLEEDLRKMQNELDENSIDALMHRLYHYLGKSVALLDTASLDTASLDTASLEVCRRPIPDLSTAEFASLLKCSCADSSAWRQLLPEKLREEDDDTVECAVVDYTDYCNAWRKHRLGIAAAMHASSTTVLQFLTRGRVVRIVERHATDARLDRQWGYGAVVNITTKRVPHSREPELFLDVVLRVADSATRGSVITLSQMQPHPAGNVERVILYGAPNPIDKTNPHFETFRVPLKAVADITKLRLKLDESSEKQSEEFRLRVGMKLLGLLCRQPVIDCLHPVDEMGLAVSDTLAAAVKEMGECEKQLRHASFYGWRWTETIVSAYHSRIDVANRINSIQSQLQAAQHPRNTVQLKAMTEVLRRLDYIDKDDVITYKGRACCDLSAVDTLIMGELLFNFKDMVGLSSDYLCAMMSCLVHEEPVKTVTHLDDPKLQTVYDEVLATARKIAETSVKCGIDIDPLAYVQKFTPALMVPARDWVRNRPFGEIMREHPDLYEGSVVRSFRRLEEALRECAACAHAMGSETLEELFLVAIKNHRKGIVFQASLYL